jgi:hypothetical protein
MRRLFAFSAALMVSAMVVTSACTAAQGEPGDGAISFTVEPSQNNAGRVHAEFRNDERGNRNRWSSDFAAAELAGLDLARLLSNGPVRFALVREAGRMDCAGNGGNGEARGTCRFTPDAAFIDSLVRRGMKRPTDGQALSLMAVNVRRDIVDALTAARYPMPSIDNLIALTAVGVTGPYISGLARAGYRPDDLDTLLQFKALNITPEWIRGFVQMGYAKLPPDQLVQLKALDIDAPFVAGFERLGYGRVAADDLVQFKALGITPDFVADFRRLGYAHLAPDELVQLKALGITPEFASRMRRNGQLPSANRLVELRVGADILDRN